MTQSGVPREQDVRRFEQGRHSIETAVVWRTYLPGDPRNRTGFAVECDVILHRDRRVLRNCMVMQRGESLAAHGPRWQPADTTRSLEDENGEIVFQSDDPQARFSRLDLLDGEQVIVAFVRSSNTDAVILGSLSHPGGELNPRSEDGRVHRTVHQGSVRSIESDGGMRIDISQAAAGEQGVIDICMLEGQQARIQQGGETLTMSTIGGTTTIRHTSGMSITINAAEVKIQSEQSQQAIRLKGPGTGVIDIEPTQIQLSKQSDPGQIGGSLTLFDDLAVLGTDPNAQVEIGTQDQKITGLAKEWFLGQQASVGEPSVSIRMQERVAQIANSELDTFIALRSADENIHNVSVNGRDGVAISEGPPGSGRQSGILVQDGRFAFERVIPGDIIKLGQEIGNLLDLIEGLVFIAPPVTVPPTPPTSILVSEDPFSPISALSTVTIEVPLIRERLNLILDLE